MRFLTLTSTALAVFFTTTYASEDSSGTDQYQVTDLTTTSTSGHGHGVGNNIVSFNFHDLSTEPAQRTHCSVTFPHGPYWPARPQLCEDNWFAFQIYRFGGLHDFELELHHAYGDNCTFCNDPYDDRFDGVTGSATFQVTQDMDWKYATVHSGGTATSWTKDDLVMDVAFDDGRTFYDRA